MILMNRILKYEKNNLFEFIYYSIIQVHSALSIKSRLVVSSSLNIPREIKGQDRVISICKELKATHYINPIGGLRLYDSNSFYEAGVQLFFQKVKPYTYMQFNHDFVPHLTIADLVMFKGNSGAQSYLSEMELLVGV